MKLGEIVAANIRKLRQAQDLTQEELASRVGINRNYVGMIERCENSPTLDMIERLAKVLAVEPSELLKKGRF